MQDKPLKNIFTPEVKAHLLKSLESPNKDLIKQRIFNQLYTKYPQVSKAHQPTFLSFVFQRHVVGAFLVLLVLGTALAANLIEPTPGDNVPYITKNQLQRGELFVLDIFSKNVAQKYRNTLIARRLTDLGMVVENPQTNPQSIVFVTNNLAERLGEYYGGKFSPDETMVAVNTAQKVSLMLQEAKKTLEQKGVQDGDVANSIEQAGRLSADILKSQVEAKLAEAKKASKNVDLVASAEESYEQGDFLAALEKLESVSDTSIQVVKGEQTDSVQEASESAIQEAPVPASGETTSTAVAVVQKQKPVLKGNPQVEYAVSIGD